MKNRAKRSSNAADVCHQPTGVIVAKAPSLPEDLELAAMSPEALRLELKSLRQSEQRLHQIMDHVPAYIAYVDATLRYRFVNTAYLTLIGKTREQIIGNHVRDVLGLDYFERARSKMEEALAGKRVRFETNLQHQGKTLFLAVEYVPDKDSGGVLHGLYVMVLEITERKRLEKALREKQDRLAQAVMLSKLGIWEWDAVSDRTAWNEEMFRIYGITAEEFSGRGSDYFAFTRQDYRALQQQNIAGAFAGGITETELARGVPPKSDPKELCIVRPDGTECYTLGDAVCIVDEQRRPLRMLGITMDITERKRAEEALRKSEECHRTILQAAMDGIWLADSQGRLSEVNDAYSSGAL